MWLHMTSETHMQSLWRVFLKQIRVPVKKPWLEPFWTTPRPCCMWRRRSKRTKHTFLFSNRILLSILCHGLRWQCIFLYFFLPSGCSFKVSKQGQLSLPHQLPLGCPSSPSLGLQPIFQCHCFFIPLLSRWQPAVFPQRTFSPKLSLGHVCRDAGPPCPT